LSEETRPVITDAPERQVIIHGQADSHPGTYLAPSGPRLLQGLNGSTSTLMRQRPDLACWESDRTVGRHTHQKHPGKKHSKRTSTGKHGKIGSVLNQYPSSPARPGELVTCPGQPLVG
jgi:hypothetical protein